MPTYKNPTEAKAGLTSAFGSALTPAQQTAIDNAASLVPTTPVDASALGTTSSLKLPSAPTPTTPNIQNLQVTEQTAPTTAPTQATTITDKLSGLVAKITGKDADKAQTVETETSPYRKQLNELNTQIKLHQANSIAREEAAMNRVGGTTSSNAVATQQQQRTDAIEGLKLAAFAEAMQGNISLAENHAKTAVDAKYAEIQRDLLTTKNNIYDNWETFTAAEKKRASATLLQIDKDDAMVAQQKEDDKAILNIGMKLSEYGVDMKTVQSVLESGNVKKALTLASSKLQDPKAKMELESLRLDQILKKAQIAKTTYETELLKKYDGLSPSEYRKALKEEQDAIEAEKDEVKKNELQAKALGEKVTLLDSLLENRAIDSVVGPSALSRAPSTFMGVAKRIAGFTAGGAAAGLPFGGAGAIPGAVVGLGLGVANSLQGSVDRVTGSADKLVGQTEQFISKEFLQNLIDTKAAGASFGALTKAEQDALTAAATFIGQRRVCGFEKNGQCGENSKVTGYDMSEEDFKREISVIQDSARKAYERSVGKSFLPDEEGALDSIYGGTANPQHASLINYYP